MNHYKLDENKNPIPCSMEEWAEQLEYMHKTKTKHVVKEIINGKFISTIWLGLNHNWGNNNLPLLFETMVFADINTGCEEYCDRYSTWKEAEEGHKKAVEWVKNGCKEEDTINE